MNITNRKKERLYLEISRKYESNYANLVEDITNYLLKKGLSKDFRESMHKKNSNLDKILDDI